MKIASSNNDFHSFHPKPAAHWRRSQKGNKGAIIIIYGRRRTGDFRTCILRTKGLKQRFPAVDFRRVRYSTDVYFDEAAGCRNGWSNIKARILDAASAA